MQYDLSGFDPKDVELVKQLLAAGVTPPKAAITQKRMEGMPIGAFARQHFYLDDGSTLNLFPHQKIKFDYAFNPLNCPPFGFQTILNSTIKKSGKTEEAALVSRWVSETWGGANQVYTVANDKEQNRGRIYGAVVRSIEKDPYYDKGKRVLSSAEGIDRWRIIERDLLHLPTSSIIRAIAGDHEGEAGSNPTLTAWTEIWALRLERDKRLWAEMTPVPTRPRSMRYVETYAGYKGESNILWDLWQQAVKDGKHLTIEDVPTWPFEPDDDEGHIPFYVNYQARLFAYIDQGIKARRMSWQQGEEGEAYYSAQAYALRNEPGQFERLHLNEWVEKSDAFIPIQWWLNCYDPVLLEPQNSLEAIAQKRIPCVVGVDASVSGDCTAISLVHRHPVVHSDTCVRLAIKWKPSKSEPMDYRNTVERTIKEWFQKFNVVEVAYDPTQLHHLMYELRRTDRRRADPDYFPPINTVAFPQNSDRRLADKALYDFIREQRIKHDGFIGGGYDALTEHLQNAGREIELATESRMKIVKQDIGDIDLTIATAMANHRCLQHII